MMSSSDKDNYAFSPADVVQETINDRMSWDDNSDSDNSDISVSVPSVGNMTDRFNFVRLTMTVLGTCTLLPWNFFINASNYWMYKFRDVSQKSDKVDFKHKTVLQSTFESYLTVSATVTLAVFLFISTALSHKVRQEIRVISSLVSFIILFCITVSFVKVDTDSWQYGFLGVTLVIVVLVNAATAIFQGAAAGIAGMLPSTCMHALMNGQALGGIFASVANILTLMGHTSETDAALAYFLIAAVVSIMTIILYLFLNRSKYFRYHTQHARLVAKEHESEPHLQISIMTVFIKIWSFCFSSWFILTTTLSVFPAILVNAVSENVDSHSKWTSSLYVPVVVFLLFNVSDFAGRMVSHFVMLPKLGSRLIHVLGVCRVAIIPFILLCNLQPRHHLPVIFHHDYLLVTFVTILGITNGYLFTLVMMYGPTFVVKEEQEVAGSMLAAFSGCGVMCGSLIGMAIVHTI